MAKPRTDAHRAVTGPGRGPAADRRGHPLAESGQQSGYSGPHAQNRRGARGLGHRVDHLDNNPIPDSFADDFLLYWASLAMTLVRTGRRTFGSSFDPTRLDNLTMGPDRHAAQPAPADRHHPAEQTAQGHRALLQRLRHPVDAYPHRGHPADRPPRPRCRLPAGHRPPYRLGRFHPHCRTPPVSRRSHFAGAVGGRHAGGDDVQRPDRDGTAPAGTGLRTRTGTPHGPASRRRSVDGLRLAGQPVQHLVAMGLRGFGDR